MCRLQTQPIFLRESSRYVWQTYRLHGTQRIGSNCAVHGTVPLDKYCAAELEATLKAADETFAKPADDFDI